MNNKADKKINTKDLSTEALAVRDLYWATVDAGGVENNVNHVWQEMVDTIINMRYSKLRGMEKALETLNSQCESLLGEISNNLKESNGVVDKRTDYLYKERIKVLKKKAKLGKSIIQEKERLVK